LYFDILIPFSAALLFQHKRGVVESRGRQGRKKTLKLFSYRWRISTTMIIGREPHNFGLRKGFGREDYTWIFHRSDHNSATVYTVFRLDPAHRIVPVRDCRDQHGEYRRTSFGRPTSELPVKRNNGVSIDEACNWSSTFPADCPVRI